MEHRTEDQRNVAIQQVLPVGNVPLHHGGSRGLMSCQNVGRRGEGGRGMPFRGVSRTDLRLTTALLTSSSSALSSAESQSIAWRAPSWMTSHRAQRGGIRARPLELRLVTAGEYDLVGFPEPSGNLQPMPEPGRRTRG